MWLLTLLIPANILVFNPAAELVEKHQVILDKLEMCESGMNKNIYNPKDSDGLEKFGCMQFDIPTAKQFIGKYGMYGSEVWDEADLKNWLYDCDFSRKLAARMIEDGYISRWGCYGKI